MFKKWYYIKRYGVPHEELRRITNGTHETQDGAF